MYLLAEDARRQIGELLVEWCDALLRLQLNKPDCKRLDGAILCPVCGGIHGRCHEAVYPLLCAAKLTKDPAYLTAAKRLYAWGENLQCSDGGFRNDFKSEWRGVTAFAAIALHDALFYHSDLLSAEEKADWESRLAKMGEWLFQNLTESAHAYLNYFAANACAMALLGTRFSNDDYLALAKRLASFCLAHVSENGLVFGEGSPIDAVSPKGCLAIDAGGYNAEETLPCLCRCAAVLGERRILDACTSLWRAQLLWMLPDGAWDDSTGTRSFKWTYWGSRTSDGCQAALFELGNDDPVFAEAAWRNFELYRRCTQDGLLAGGPDYTLHGEPLCVHHTFCHAKVLAAALDSGVPAFERCALPSDAPELLKYYPEQDTYRLANGKWRMDVCGCDFSYSGVSHATGGSVTQLWHETAGPLIAVGAVDSSLREPHNQQLSVRPETVRNPCPRIVWIEDGKAYGQHHCSFARLSSELRPDGPVICVQTALCAKDGQALPRGDCELEYRLTEECLFVTGHVNPEIADRARFVLPLISDKAKVEVIQGALLSPPVEMFSMSPGFLAREYTIRPDKKGGFRIRIFMKI